MANAYMDYFAQTQHALGHTYYQSLQWPQWAQVGMAAGAKATDAYHHHGFELVDNQTGLDLLSSGLGIDEPVLLPSVVNDAQLRSDKLLYTKIDDKTIATLLLSR